MLYNFLYGAYRKTGRPREAMKLMKETVQLFPNYLFGRVEYALYLLRRGEPEKAHAALENAGTLSQLYPERKIFHAAEWKAFAYAMGLSWIQKGDINQAKIYLAIIQKIAPKSSQITDLQQKMKSKLFLQSMEKLQKELKPQMSTG
jgi:tetratricopeptide (TPR) repeat protein